MLIRLIAENIASFNEPTEFNTFPSSRSHKHENHKITCGHATALRMAAIYGANGAGKSNLIAILNILSNLVKVGSVNGFRFRSNLKHMFAEDNNTRPCGIAIEYFYDNKIFYYHIEFTPEEIVSEELLLSGKNKDELIFSRNNGVIKLIADFVKGNKILKGFMDGLEKLVRPDMLFLNFMAVLYPEEVPLMTSAYSWFKNVLNFVTTGSYMLFIPHLMDTKDDFSKMVNTILPKFSTGISKIRVAKKQLNPDTAINDPALSKAMQLAKLNPGKPQPITTTSSQTANIVYEDGAYVMKTIESVHEANGLSVSMPLEVESDGTRRLIDYMPLFYNVMKRGSVYVVDEIERSIHPMLIKALMETFSHDQDVKGQLIFTTHESCLLDQDILRPDEIWFAQKDSLQATQLYPLSDYNIHNTANIENGYLNGRYGGIPFLSNLKDLHWGND